MSINIRASATMRNSYTEIADLCKQTQEPVYLTKNGIGDLVVMDIEAFHRREKMLDLREKLLAAEESRLNGSEGYSIRQVTEMMRRAIGEATAGGAEK